MAEILFEKNLEKLDAIVSRLENGNVSLDEALKLYEEGAKLAVLCEKQLDKAVQVVLKLTKNAEGVVEEIPVDVAEVL